MKNDEMRLTHGELFAGISGFGLGFSNAGIKTLWHVEIDARCQEVLRYHYPDTLLLADVRDCGKHNLPYADIISGGFPCQDVSVAGYREGLDGKRSGLWFEMLRIIRELEPRWVVVENVVGLLSVNAGRAFGTVLRNLAQSGYDATWQVLSARTFGAIHRRERVFIVANRDGKRIEGFWQEPIQRVAAFSWVEDVRRVEDLRGRSDIPEPLVRRGGNGVSFRVDALGNAVVPQIAEWIAKRIVQLDSV